MYLSVFYRGILLFGWVVFIMTLLLTPMPLSEISDELTFTDKIVHALIFGILSFLLFYFFKGYEETAWLRYNKRKKKKDKERKKAGGVWLIFICSFVISALYSLVLEFVQDFIPGRSASHQDFLASVIGMLLVLIFVYGDGYYKKA